MQFVRKISGYGKPSAANQAAFDAAVADVTAASRQLLSSLTTNATPKNREQKAAKRRARSERRFA